MKKILLTALLIQGAYSFSQNLVLHYSMDNMTSTTLPANNLSYHGTGPTAVFVKSGVTGLSTDYYARFNYGKGLVSDSALNNQTWNGAAISLWYNSLSTNQGTLVQGSYLGFGVRMLTNGKVQPFFNGTQTGAGNSTSIVNDGQWHHILAQTDGTKTYLYIDGVLEYTKTETYVRIAVPNAQARIFIGNAANDANDQRIVGKIDEVKIFDNALSQAQIDALASCVVSIPDPNFKAYLVGNILINTNGDSEIQCTEAAAYSGIIECSNLLINDLTGIETFTSLTRLHCNDNQLTSLDVSNILSLEILNCNNNNISALDLSYNTSLVEIECGNNQLTSLNIANGNNTNLYKFKAKNNPNLLCITLDDENYSTNNWGGVFFQFDPIVSFSENCGSTTGINEANSINLSLYPNPASDIINIQTDATIVSSSIFDLAGNLIATFKGNEFGVGHLTNGVYFITVQTENGIAQHKFVKQ